MGSPYTPVPGQIRILETDSYRQLKRPLAPREIKAGDALWLNKYTSSNLIDSWVEPALNTPSGYTTNPLATASSTLATYASTSASLAAEQEAFAALFVGFSLLHTTPRSFNKYLNFASPNVNSAVYYDSTAPFITVVTAGIADCPYWDGTNNQIPAGYEYPVDYGVALSGFLNASTFFTDCSGMAPTALKYYCYNNSVQVTATASAIIGRLVKNAKAGDTTVRIAFSSFMSVPASGQVAGLMMAMAPKHEEAELAEQPAVQVGKKNGK